MSPYSCAIIDAEVNTTGKMRSSKRTLGIWSVLSWKRTRSGDNDPRLSSGAHWAKTYRFLYVDRAPQLTGNQRAVSWVAPTVAGRKKVALIDVHYAKTIALPQACLRTAEMANDNAHVQSDPAPRISMSFSSLVVGSKKTQCLTRNTPCGPEEIHSK